MARPYEAFVEADHVTALHRNIHLSTLSPRIWNLNSRIWNPKLHLWSLNLDVWNPNAHIWSLNLDIWNLNLHLWIQTLRVATRNSRSCQLAEREMVSNARN